MTDHEQQLLGLAARAAGYQLTWKRGACKGGTFVSAFIEGKVDAWNPYTDRGDAFKLAARMGMRLTFSKPTESSGGYCQAEMLSQPMRRNVCNYLCEEQMERAMCSVIVTLAASGQSAKT